MSALCQKRTSVRLATALYPCPSLFRMRRPQVWKLVENVGVRFEARGRLSVKSAGDVIDGVQFKQERTLNGKEHDLSLVR
jgi:hypothetical protein